MTLDLDDPLGLQSFIGEVAGRPRTVVQELLGAELGWPTSADGRQYCTELVVPFLNQRPGPAPAPARVDLALRGASPRPERHGPGSRWLTVKAYGSSGQIDRLLAGSVPPILAEIAERAGLERWFFLRFRDPHPHLRLRVRLADTGQLGTALEVFARHLGPLAEQRRLRGHELGEYLPEYVRYGGERGMELAEQIFEADSRCCLALLPALLEHPAGEERRWRLAVLGCARLLNDFGLGSREQAEVLAPLAASFAQEFAVGPRARAGMSALYRSERAFIDELCSGGSPGPAVLAGASAELDQRSRVIGPAALELQALAARGQLAVGVPDVVGTLLHMFVNRWCRAHPRAHEAVIYPLLEKGLRSLAARQRLASTPAATLPERGTRIEEVNQDAR